MNRGDRLPLPTMEVEDISRKSATVKIYQDKDTFAGAVRRLAVYKALPVKMKPVMEKIADYVRTEMIPRTFEEEGPGWAPLAQRTIVERTRDGYGAAHPILIREGDLFAELTEKSHPKHIEIIKTGRLARIEIGGSSEKFIENQMGLANVPARPMVPGTGFLKVPDRDRIAIREIISKALGADVK